MLSEEPGIADNEYGLAHDNDDYNRRFERSDDMLQRRMAGESSDAMHMEEDVEDAEAADLVAEKDYFNKGQRRGVIDDDQTTQCSVPASMLTRNVIPH